MTRDLGLLRADIERIDGEIAELIERRMELAEEVAKTKMAEGLPIVNQQAEAKVYDRYRRAAENYGLRIETMESIARLLISEAVWREERVTR
jgi:chorismate mutase/prephenate dehydratase